MHHYYDTPDELPGTVFDPTSPTFGPIMAAIHKGDFEDASIMLAQLSKKLRHVEHTDTILFGPTIGSAETKHGRMEVIGSGGTVRFTLAGHDGYVDLDLQPFASAALATLVG